MSLSQLYMVLGSAIQGTVTVSGHIISSSNVGANATAELKIDDDGNTYERFNGIAYLQIDSTDDWVRPTAAAPGLYEVRFTSLTGDTADLSSNGTEDTWFSLSTGDLTLTLTDTDSGVSQKLVSFTIQIRYNGGSVLDSAGYTLIANRELS